MTTWKKRAELLSNFRTQIEVQQAALGLDDFQLGARIGVSRLMLSRLKKGEAD